MKTEISNELVENLLNMFIKSTEVMTEVAERQSGLINDLLDYIEFLEQQADSIEEGNMKELAKSNMDLKKALNLSESLIKFGTKEMRDNAGK
jgi:uncharacterized protein Yka (UPF0111/DUF47 family)